MQRNDGDIQNVLQRPFVDDWEPRTACQPGQRLSIGTCAGCTIQCTDALIFNRKMVDWQRLQGGTYARSFFTRRL